MMLTKKRKPFLYGSLAVAVDHEYDRIRARLEEQQAREYFYRLVLPRRRDRQRSDLGLGADFDE